jgi:hypothetical protein
MPIWLLGIRLGSTKASVSAWVAPSIMACCLMDRVVFGLATKRRRGGSETFADWARLAACSAGISEGAECGFEVGAVGDAQGGAARLSLCHVRLSIHLSGCAPAAGQSCRLAA